MPKAGLVARGHLRSGRTSLKSGNEVRPKGEGGEQRQPRMVWTESSTETKGGSWGSGPWGSPVYLSRRIRPSVMDLEKQEGARPCVAL